MSRYVINILASRDLKKISIFIILESVLCHRKVLFLLNPSDLLGLVAGNERKDYLNSSSFSRINSVSSKMPNNSSLKRIISSSASDAFFLSSGHDSIIEDLEISYMSDFKPEYEVNCSKSSSLFILCTLVKNFKNWRSMMIINLSQNL